MEGLIEVTNNFCSRGDTRVVKKHNACRRQNLKMRMAKSSGLDTLGLRDLRLFAETTYQKCEHRIYNDT